jgi:hypothetical protein
MEKENRKSTPYDDVFRTMATYLPGLVVPILNEIFRTEYDENTLVEVKQNEHFSKDNGIREKRETDSNFCVNGTW